MAEPEAMVEREDLSPDEIAQLEQEIQELAESAAPEISEDWNDAIADDGYEWYIPTGKFKENGKQIYVLVKAIDPKQPDLPTRYIQTVQRFGEERAMTALWQACVTEPIQMKNPEIIKKTTTAFQSSLTYRLLGLIGVNADFFEAMAAMNSRARSPAQTKSSTSSHTSTGKTPTPSEDGAPKSSTEPGDSPVKPELKTEQTSSSTSSTPQQKHSEEPKPSPSSTPLQLSKRL